MAPRRASHGEQLLVLLALLLLARCVLDPWNNVYYELPFLLALLAWEALCRPERPPVLALAATVATWATFQQAPLYLSPDLQSMLFRGMVAAAGGVAGARVLRARRPRARPPCRAHGLRVSVSHVARTPSARIGFVVPASTNARVAAWSGIGYS